MLKTINYILWINISIILLIISIKLTIKSKFIQFRIITMIKQLLKKSNNQGISSLSSLMITLGGKIGVGSISGIALAIYYGGPGTILWIIIFSLIISVITYYEVYLGNIYKEKDENNIYKGGPSYYIKKGLKKHSLSIIYTILVVICYNGCFLSIQANTIMKITNNYFNTNKIIIGLILCITTLLIIYKGIKQISKISNILVPIMLIIYIFLGIYILIHNITKINKVINIIIKNAFNIKTLIYSFIPMIIISLQRAIFATESGIGTSAISGSTTNSDPKKQAYIQTLGVHITSLVICITTAIIILTTNYQILKINNINGIELVIYSFNYHFGRIGKIILYIIILLFCLSTIITGYYNGESSIKSFKIKKVTFLKIITTMIIFLGVLIESHILWRIADILIGLMLIINIYTIYFLRKEVKEK